MEYAQWNACGRKLKYKSRKNAEKAIKSIRKKKFIVHTPRIYKCDFCSGYHLTHQEERHGVQRIENA